MVSPSYHFYIHKIKGWNTYPLKLMVRWDSNSVVFNVGYKVDPNKWSRDTQRCMLKSYHGDHKISAAVINGAIQALQEEVENIFESYNRKGIYPYPDDIRGAIRHSSKSSDINIIQAFNKFIDTESAKSSWTYNTKKKITTVRNHLKEYSPDMDIENVTEQELYSYLKWLNSNEYRNTTIFYEIKIIKWFLRWASKNNMYSGDAHEKFDPKIKTADREVIYLTFQELSDMMKLELSGRLDYARDCFCFCCFTGLRFSDMCNLNKSDIKDDCISVTTVKTTDSLRIDLNNYSRSILDKYANVKFKNGKALPHMANQEMNRLLKKLGKMLELNEPITMVDYYGSERVETTYNKWELLTTHCGRRTFVVNAMYLGVPDSVIMSWTGHSSIEAMKPYRKVVDESKRREMNKFDELLSKNV